jgi:hypothetical protein
METTSPALASDRLNAVRQYVVYGPGRMPSVEVFSCPDDSGVDPRWAAGEIRMHTVHEDGSRTFTVQFRHAGRLLVDNFAHDRVRHDPDTQTADAAC